jgi:hypothetical protein
MLLRLTLVLGILIATTAFMAPTSLRSGRLAARLQATIVSPFDSSSSGSSSSASATNKPSPSDDDDDFDDDDDLPLTAENVELVLDEMRPYLKADGGNVRLAEIDGPIVKLELEGSPEFSSL